MEEPATPAAVAGGGAIRAPRQNRPAEQMVAYPPTPVVLRVHPPGALSSGERSSKEGGCGGTEDEEEQEEEEEKGAVGSGDRESSARGWPSPRARRLHK